MKRTILTTLCAAGMLFAAIPSGSADTVLLPSVPQNLPSWMRNQDVNHLFYQRGRYNFDVYDDPGGKRHVFAS